MLPRDKILKETSPLSIFFVKSGSGGNRLLFRYPYDDGFEHITAGNESTLEQDRIQLRNIINEDDEALCNMFSVNPNLCGQKFEIKINSVRHVGHPVSLLPPTASSNSSQIHPSTVSRQGGHHHQVNLDLSSYDSLTAPSSGQSSNQGDITSFNIVCALRASASFDIVDCYHDLSKRLAIALSFEERRCSYLSKEIKTILATLDESDMANYVDQDQQDHKHKSNSSLDKHHAGNANITIGDRDSDGYKPDVIQQKESVFATILSRSNLAKDLKRVFISLTTTGVVDLKINNWISVSFCLPQKVHRLKLITHKSMAAISTRDIKRCLLYLRPYHGLLLLHETQELLDSLPIDASPAFIQLIKVTKPDKNFMDLSVDANLTLMQIFCIVSQLIYWAKATIIYPVCDSNIYAIHPLASTGTQSTLVRDFRIRFPQSKSLHEYLADFSEGISLSQLNGPLLNLEDKLNLLNIVTWLLQRRILIQVHKYIFLVLDREDPPMPPSGGTNRPLSSKQRMRDFINQSSPRGIDISSANNNFNNYSNSSNSNHYISGDSNNTRSSYQTNGQAKLLSMTNSGSLVESSPQMMFKHSLADSNESSMRRDRTDSLPESQDDINFGLNSSLSSTPNSTLEYPSPSNETMAIRFSLSSSCPLDNQGGPNRLESDGSSSMMSALQRAGLTQAGAKNVLAVPSSKNPDDLKLLIKLIPYFDGKHHIEDIMFFENLERSQVLILCDKFRDILFTCHYEDVAVSQLSPFDNGR